jgi:hypothetical protein
MRLKRRPSDLSIHTQVIKLIIMFFFLSALFFYLLAAHASMLRAAIRLMLDDVGYSCFISISQQTVSDALHEVGNRSLEPAQSRY